MTFARKVTGTVTGLALAATLSACGSSDDTSLQMGTGGTGGVYYPLGNELASLFEEHADVENLSVSGLETDASVHNIAAIERGDYELGMAQNNTAFDAVNGAGEFEGGTVENVGFIGQLYPEAAQVLTLESSGFETINDLEGATISTGAPGSGTQAVAQAILAAHGLESDDYSAVDESFADARAKLQDGQIDASIEIVGVPGASVTELNATNDVRLLPVEGTEQEQVSAESDFEPYTIEAGAYEFLEEPLETVSVFAVMLASTEEVSDDVAYELTRVMYEHASDISIEQGGLINLDEALTGQGDIPLHPGAQEFYEDEGLL